MPTSKPEHRPEHLEHHADTTTTVETQRPVEIAQKTEQTPVTEQAFEQYKQVDENKPEESPYVVRQAKRKDDDQIMVDDAQKTPSQIEIENIMANGLDTVYGTMDAAQQEKFKRRGEEVAKAIDILSAHLKLTARRVLHLIRSWLKLIPGINRYFLEQEAKLKTDDIMKYEREQLAKRKQLS